MKNDKNKTSSDKGYITEKIEKILAEDISDDSIYKDIDRGDTIKLDGIMDIERNLDVESDALDSEGKDSEVLEKETLKNEMIDAKDEFRGSKKNQQKCKVIIISCSILIVLIMFILLFVFLNRKDNNNENLEEEEPVLTISLQKEIINNYGKAVENVIGVYFRKNNILLEYRDAIKLVKLENEVSCSVHEVYDDGLIFLDKCEIDGEKTKIHYGIKQEKKEESVKKEGAVHVYVNKVSSEATLIKPKYLEGYDDYSFDIEGVYSNLTLLDAWKSNYVIYVGDGENVGMINFKTGEKVIPQVNYQAVLPIKIGEAFDINRVGVLIDNKWGIYDIKSGGCVIYPRYDSISVNLNLGTNGSQVYATAPQTDILIVNYNGAVGAIDYQRNKEVIPIIYNGILKSGDYLWAIDSKSIGHIYDFSGNLYLEDEYDKLYGIVDGKYVLVNDNDSIKLVLLNKDVVYDYGKLELGECSYWLSYNGGALFQFRKNDSSSCIEIVYDVESKKGKVEDNKCGGIA